MSCSASDATAAAEEEEAVEAKSAPPSSALGSSFPAGWKRISRERGGKWGEYQAQSGDKFYWNNVTKESYWHKPAFMWPLRRIVSVPRSRYFFTEFISFAAAAQGQDSTAFSHKTTTPALLSLLYGMLDLVDVPGGPERVHYAKLILQQVRDLVEQSHAAFTGLSDAKPDWLQAEVDSVSQLEGNPLLAINPFTLPCRKLMGWIEEDSLHAFREHSLCFDLDEANLNEHQSYPPIQAKDAPAGGIQGWYPDTLAGSLAKVFRDYAKEPAFGTRHKRYKGIDRAQEEEFSLPPDDMIPSSPKPYRWINFGTLWKHVQGFASGFRSILNASSSVEQSKAAVEIKDASSDTTGRHVVALCGKNRAEWCTADLACFVHGMVGVPVAFTADDKTVNHILSQTECTAVVLPPENISMFVDEPWKDGAPSSCEYREVKLVIVMDETVNGPEQLAQLEAIQPHLSSVEDAIAARNAGSDKTLFVSYTDVLEAGLKQPFARSVVPGGESAMSTICYTSGSTGVPKGAVMSYTRWANLLNTKYAKSSPYFVLSCAPLAHMAERQLYLITLVGGGGIAFYSGDMTVIFDDIAQCRPTIHCAVPRFYNQIYSEYQAALEEAKNDADPSQWSGIEQNVLKQFKNLMGGRLQTIITGSAPTSEAVKQFLKDCYGCPVIDGYGTSEAGGISSDNKINPDVECKLVDVPELGYLSTDKPYPRGEIWVKTKTMVTCYFKNQAATDKSFVDGWFRTGDVGQQEAEGVVRIIDRVKNVFKTAQGEFVAAEALEIDFLESPFVDQIYIHADTSRSYIMAVVVPNLPVLVDWACGEVGEIAEIAKRISRSSLSRPDVEGNEVKQHDAEESTQAVQELCSRPECQTQVRASLKAVGAAHKMQSYEIPAVVLLDSEKFSPENSCLTMSHKLARRGLSKRYKDQLVALANAAGGSSGSTSDQLQSLLDEVGAAGKSGGALMDQLGNDSLSAVRLVALVRERFSKDVPIQMLFDGKTNVNDLVSFIEGNQTNIPAESKEEGQHEAVVDLDMPLELNPEVLSKEAPLWEAAKQAEIDAYAQAEQRRALQEQAMMAKEDTALVRAISTSENEEGSDAPEVVELELPAMSRQQSAEVMPGVYDATLDRKISRVNIKLQAVAAFRNTSAQSESKDDTNDSPATASAAGLAASATASSSVVDPASSILLTGATGFLGSFLLHQLLQLTRADSIFCVVRASDEAAGLARLRNSLSDKVGLSDDDLQSLRFDQRVIAIPGELNGDVRCGWPEDTWNQLAKEVGAIYHCAALVNWVKGYSSMREPNVLGTWRLLQLATTVKLKRFNYISTISTAGRTEEDRLDADVAVRGSPYGLSKWVAEGIVLRARDAGVPCSVFRPGMVAGATTNGYSNPTQFIDRFFMGIVQLGAYPDEAAPLDLTPVDYVARTIVRVGTRMDTLDGCFHIANDTAAATYKMVGQAAVVCGYQLECLPYAEWRQRLLHSVAPANNKASEQSEGDSDAPPQLIRQKSGDEANALYRLLPFFGERFNLAIGPWSCVNTHNALDRCAQDSASGLQQDAAMADHIQDIHCPPISRRLLTLYFSSLNKRGHIPPVRV